MTKVDGLSCICGNNVVCKATVDVEGIKVNQLYCCECGIIMRSPEADKGGKWLEKHWRSIHMDETEQGRSMINLKPCPKCNIQPVRETRVKMLGKIQDGGYSVTQGRFKCPKCGDTPGWGRCYCVDYGWDKNAEVWNEFVEEKQ